MKEPDQTPDGATPAVSTRGDVGDAETAGETTAAAAAAINGGTTDPRPVGADTLVKVADTPDDAGRAHD